MVPKKKTVDFEPNTHHDSLDPFTCAVLEDYTAQLPGMEDSWYGLWHSILMSLFLPSQGYIVNPQQCIPSNANTYIPEVIFKVTKL
jgi:hypothetical protein